MPEEAVYHSNMAAAALRLPAYPTALEVRVRVRVCVHACARACMYVCMCLCVRMFVLVVQVVRCVRCSTKYQEFHPPFLRPPNNEQPFLCPKLAAPSSSCVDQHLMLL